MEFRTRPRTVDQACWNAEAMEAYVDSANGVEKRFSDNPDVTVTPGSLTCSGCVANRHGLGTMCTAQLTTTLVDVHGTPKRRPNEAFATAELIPGFELVQPGSRRIAQGWVDSAISTSRSDRANKRPKSILMRLLGR